MRRPLALTALAAVLAASLTGCVFVPGMVGAGGPDEIPEVSEAAPPEQSEDAEQTQDVDETDADDTGGPDAEESDAPDSSYGLDEWPDEVPKPQGNEYPSDDPSMIMVDGDQAAYDAYLQELEDAGFTVDYDLDDDSGMSWWTNGEYRVLVMLLGNILSATVTEEYF